MIGHHIREFRGTPDDNLGARRKRFMRDFRIDNLRLKPNGPIEIISLMPSCFYYNKYLRADIVCDVKSPHEITVTLNSYYGPGMHAIGKSQTISVGTAKDATSNENGFQLIEFNTKESGPYCLDGSFEFRYSGKGTAKISLLSIARV